MIAREMQEQWALSLCGECLCGGQIGLPRDRGLSGRRRRTAGR